MDKNWISEDVYTLILWTMSHVELMSKRSALDIIENVLVVALEDSTKTQITYKANLNFIEAGKYVDFLLSRGLLITDSSADGRKQFRTTERGRIFLKRFKGMIELLC